MAKSEVGIQKRTPQQRVADLILMEALHLRGASQNEIAKAISDQRPYNLSRAQIAYDLADLQRQWQQQALEQRGLWVAQELAKIRNLEREYWHAWERSLLEQTRTRTEQGTTGQIDKDGNPGKSAKAVIEKETPTGVPAYLAGIMACIERRCKLLGLDAPTQLQVDWRREAEEVGINVSEIYGQLIDSFAEAIQTGQRSADDPSLGRSEATSSQAN